MSRSVEKLEAEEAVIASYNNRCGHPGVGAPENEFKVSPRQWKKWGTLARHTFNWTFYHMRRSGHLINRDTADMTVCAESSYRTIIWNAAFTAACVVQKYLRAAKKNVPGGHPAGKEKKMSGTQCKTPKGMRKTVKKKPVKKTAKKKSKK